jgi:hypothetical protein
MLSEPSPESEPVIVTEVRGEGPYAAPRATTPSPEPDPDVISKARGEDALHLRSLAASTPSPEPEEGTISHARGEDPFALLGGNGGDEETRETAVRGEDVGGEETKTRGEDPDSVDYGPNAGTGTFSRGEDDFDAPYMVGHLTKSESRGEADSDLAGTRLTATLGAATESKDGRGSIDFDPAGSAVFDAALDDPTDLRRVSILGALEARQRIRKY